MPGSTGREESSGAAGQASEAGIRPSRPAPIRDSLSQRLARRLGRFDPRSGTEAPALVRAETISGTEMLGQRLAWWRMLVSAADPANPALEPESVLPWLGEETAGRQPQFLCLWREANFGAGVRERALIGLFPLMRAAVGGLDLPWARGWAPGWWPEATPLVHRRYQAIAARALAGWIDSPQSGLGGIVLRDLEVGGTFATALVAAGRARWRAAAHRRPVLSCGGGQHGDGQYGDGQTSDGAIAGALVQFGAEVTHAALESSLALIALWTGGIGPHGIIDAKALGTARHLHLTAAADQGRITIAQALRGGRTSACAIALVSGSSASIVAAAASVRLDTPARETELSRAIGALVSAVRQRNRVTTIAGPTDAQPAIRELLPQTRMLGDLAIGGRGTSGAAFAMQERLRRHLCDGTRNAEEGQLLAPAPMPIDTLGVPTPPPPDTTPVAGSPSTRTQ